MWVSRLLKCVLISGVVAQTVSQTGTASTCCRALQQIRPLTVLLPGTEAYNARLKTYYNAAAALPAWCMAMPKTTNDASEVMKVIYKYQCPFGIKSGGHGVYRLSNAVQDGITIDMGFLNATTYMPGAVYASIGPAAESANVYRALEKYGVTVTAGRVAPVGVGGFITGGGMSYHAQAYGWAADNIVNAVVVLANGTVTNVNQNQNGDLWVAMRGGSGNFGLVTRLDMRAIPYANPRVPQIVGGLLAYDLSMGPKLIDTYIDFAQNIASDIHTQALIWWSYSRSTGVQQLIAGLSNSANVLNAPAINAFVSLGNITYNSVKSNTMANISFELTSSNGFYSIWYPNTFASDARIIAFSQQRHTQLIAALEQVVTPGNFLSTQCQFQPISQAIVSHAKGNNIMGLEPHVANGPGILFLIYATVATAADAEKATPLVRAAHQDIQRYATSLDAAWNWGYLDYASGDQEVISTFGNANIAKMRAASRKYDPQGVFQKLRGSGFKLP